MTGLIPIRYRDLAIYDLPAPDSKRQSVTDNTIAIQNNHRLSKQGQILELWKGP